MILHRDGSVRRLGAEPKPASVPDLSRVLRQARAARGLELDAVSAQTGIPLDQLHDLESGTVDRLPDRVAILKALSRYAAFLNLPGDQFVMTLVEHWPNASNGGPPVMVVHDAPTNGNRATETATGTLPAAAADDLSTRAVPLSVSTSTAPHTSIDIPIMEGQHNSTAQVPMVMADTGVTPAVKRDPIDGFGMVVVRALVVVVTLLLAVGTAWLVVNKVHPQWLADLRLPYTSKGVATPASTKATTGATGRGAGATKPTTPPKPAMELVSSSGSQASFNVTAALFDVRVSAVGGPTWVSVSGPLSPNPVFEGILKSGESHLIAGDHQLTVQIGSSAARLAVQVNKHVIGTYVPPGAPFTMTFTTK